MKAIRGSGITMSEKLESMQLARFGAWLARKRNELDMNQTELARAIRRDPSYVNQMEAGTKHPGPETCRALARVLRVSTARVYLELGDINRADIDCAALPEDVEELKTLMLSLPPDSQARKVAHVVIRGLLREADAIRGDE